uniref:AAA+ ATPase domain-containing protein n=1 Tax=Timema cristinae TaxID=61476 RepID=A0A7R9H8Y6_TIMCR|nr:unnamed protein product [Timema cristinae]
MNKIGRIVTGMNSSTEIIPIQGPSMSSRKKPSGFLNKKPKKSYPYFSDSLLLPRIQQYLEDHKDIFTHVDIDAMADYLQNKYRDYSKKKRRPFRVMVNTAFNVVNENYTQRRLEMGIHTSDEDEEEDDDDEDDDFVEASEGNRANEQLMDLYYPQKPKKNPRFVGENELIDICSDDEPEPVKVVDVNKEMFSNSMPNISIVPIGLKPKKSSSNVTSSMTAKNLPSKTRTKSGTSSPPASLVNMPAPSMPDKSTRVSAVLPANESTPQSSLGTGVKKRKPQVEENGFLPNKRRKEFTVSYSNVNFKDFAGHGKILEDVSSLIFHMSQIDSYRALGISPPRGFLLHGPPGCGKTLLAQVIAGELRVPLLKVSSPALVAGVSGESESRIRDLFDQALSLAPCVVFLDEVDAITPNRHTAQREMERRIVSQLLSCLDELGEKEGGNNVLVIGATNRPDSIDPALRRAGRFDREVSIGIPDTKARTQILKVACKNMKLEPSFNYKEVAKNAPGYVGADLIALAREASMIALERCLDEYRNKCLQKAKDNPKKTGNSSDMDISDEDSAQPKVNSTDPLPVSENNREKPSGSEQGPLNQENIFSWVRRQPPLPRSEFINMSISMKDFKAALKRVQPSAKREGFATAPVRYPEQFSSLGLTTTTGVLLCGPPGCGKTLLAKAVANEAGINFISVKGPELLTMYVGESERAVRQVFQRAKNSAPCVIFFDELDALCPRRSETADGGASMRVVNQMLTEMDGVEGRGGVFLMAASNRPDIVDPAVLRPGRLDKILYVGLPSPVGRVDILRALTKVSHLGKLVSFLMNCLDNGTRPAFSKDNSLEQLGLSQDVEGYTGADLAALIREAGLHALMDFIDSPTEGKHNLEISRDHCSRALRRIRPSVTRKENVVVRWIGGETSENVAVRWIGGETFENIAVRWIGGETSENVAVRWIGGETSENVTDQAHYEKYRRLYSAAQSKRIRTPVNKENTSGHEISSPGIPKAFGQSSHVSSTLKRPASSCITHVTLDASSHRGGCESSTAKVLKLLEETIEDDDDIMEVTPAANIVRVSDTEIDEIALLESNDEAEVLETTPPTTDSTKVKDIAPDDVISLHEINDSEDLEECSLNNIAKKTDDITTNETSLSKSDENSENAKPDTLSEVNDTSKESAKVDSEKAPENEIDEHAKVQTSL